VWGQMLDFIESAQAVQVDVRQACQCRINTVHAEQDKMDRHQSEEFSLIGADGNRLFREGSSEATVSLCTFEDKHT
jgi:hypothetical protein